MLACACVDLFEARSGLHAALPFLHGVTRSQNQPGGALTFRNLWIPLGLLSWRDVSREAQPVLGDSTRLAADISYAAVHSQIQRSSDELGQDLQPLQKSVTDAVLP